MYQPFKPFLLTTLSKGIVKQAAFIVFNDALNDVIKRLNEMEKLFHYGVKHKARPDR